MWIQISMDITRKSFDDSVHKNSTDAKSVARQRFCLFKFKSMQFDWISCDSGQFGISYSDKHPTGNQKKKNTATKKVTNLCMHTPLTRIRHSIATDLSINNECGCNFNTINLLFRTLFKWNKISPPNCTYI